MRISVIIPVYNAEKYIERAVRSVIDQKHVKEVVLVDDGSNDNSYEICKNLLKSSTIIKLYRHLNHKNKGVGASRNLGIKNSVYPFISFLDADDYYLKNRFSETKKVFNNDNNIDGVYEVIGAHYYSQNAREKHIERMSDTKKFYENPIIALEDTGVETGISSENLFSELIKDRKGWIHLNGLTIKKKSLMGMELFSEEVSDNSALDLEDSEFILRLSHEKKLISTGSPTPIANRGIHESNRIFISYKKRKIMWEKMYHYTILHDVEKDVGKLIIYNYLFNYSDNYFNCKNVLKRKILWVLNWFLLFLKNPFHIIKYSFQLF